MKIRQMLSVWSVIAVSAIVGHDVWLTSDHTYGVPLADAHKALGASGPPPVVLGSEPREVVMELDDPNRVIWVVREGGKERLRFVATLTPSGAGATRVSVDVGSADPAVAKRMGEYRTISHLYRVAISEHVAARLENRDFAVLKLAPASTVAVVANLFGLAKQMDDVAEAESRRERANIRKAYEEEAEQLKNAPR